MTTETNTAPARTGASALAWCARLAVGLVLGVAFFAFGTAAAPSAYSSLRNAGHLVHAVLVGRR